MSRGSDLLRRYVFCLMSAVANPMLGKPPECTANEVKALERELVSILDEHEQLWRKAHERTTD